MKGVSDGLSILASYYQQQDQAANDAINAQKQAVSDALQAGTITAKAAAERNAELDAQQKKLQHDQAVRNKELAIFQAIIGTASAVIQALNALPPVSFISAGIAAALGAAQIAVISAQPIPALKTGKKGSYQGPALVGEAGSELYEQDGKMFLADKPSLIWLGAQDKVYTPGETSKMFSGAVMNTAAPMTSSRVPKEINYEKIGQAVAKNMPNMSLSIDGYKEFIRTKESFITRLNARRKWQ